MNTLRNNVRLIGNLGDNPKVTKLENGKLVANFSIATNEIFKNKEGVKQSETTWHRIVAWGKLAKLAENFLVKGTEVAIEGRISNRAYETTNGNKQYITEIILQTMLMLNKN